MQVLMKFAPKDYLALFVVAGIFFMIIYKTNHSMDALLALIVGYYFAKRTNGEDKGK